jgi:hypothetical protein
MNSTNSASHSRSEGASEAHRLNWTGIVCRHSSGPQPVIHTCTYMYMCVYMHIHRKNYKLSHSKRCNCPLELDKCCLDEVKVFAVNICQIFSSYRSEQAGDNDTVVHCAA